MSELDDAIRERAYRIWEAEGRPEGKEEDHWFRAAEELPKKDAAAETGVAGGPPPPSDTPPASQGRYVNECDRQDEVSWRSLL